MNSTSTLILLIIALLRANNMGVIDSQSMQKILNELYLQPYAEFSRQALYRKFPDYDQLLSNIKINRANTPKNKAKISIQIGHLLEEELPLELINLGKNGGAKINRVKEVEINKSVAEKVKENLKNNGYNNVEIVSALLSQDYYSDVFVAIHSNIDEKNVSGFLISAPYKDYSEKGDYLKNAIISEYTKSTGMKFIDYKSLNMTKYYSFNWSRFKRAINPTTPAVILEIGNLRNINDLITITIGQDKVAKGIADGIIKFLNENN
ncbi:MAG: N-acetylmuramoyl-L-alanine amidase [Patescibacteria group bacterium]